MISKLIEDRFDSICFGLEGTAEAGEHEWQSYGTVDREAEHIIEGFECLRCDHIAYRYHRIDEV
jgi:hypothetical protein